MWWIYASAGSVWIGNWAWGHMCLCKSAVCAHVVFWLQMCTPPYCVLCASIYTVCILVAIGLTHFPTDAWGRCCTCLCMKNWTGLRKLLLLPHWTVHAWRRLPVCKPDWRSWACDKLVGALYTHRVGLGPPCAHMAFRRPAYCYGIWSYFCNSILQGAAKLSCLNQLLARHPWLLNCRGLMWGVSTSCVAGSCLDFLKTTALFSWRCACASGYYSSQEASDGFWLIFLYLCSILILT